MLGLMNPRLGLMLGLINPRLGLMLGLMNPRLGLMNPGRKGYSRGMKGRPKRKGRLADQLTMCPCELIACGAAATPARDARS